MIFRKLFSIFFSVITITAVASENNYTLSHEAKEWLREDYQTYEQQTKIPFAEDVKNIVGPQALFILLMKRCQKDPVNRMDHLIKAAHWIDYLKKDERYKNGNHFDTFAIDELINNKGTVLEDEKEKDIFYFTLSPYASNDSSYMSPHLYPISVETYNKFIYHKQIDFSVSTLAHISNSISVGNGSNVKKNLKSVFKPTMYYPLFSGGDIKDITQYSYKEVCGVLNIPTFVTCFHILKKSDTKNRLFMPRVLIRKMIEDHILRSSMNNFKDLKAKSHTFKNYCDSLESTMPELLREYNESHWATNGRCNPIDLDFKEMYAELKRN